MNNTGYSWLFAQVNKGKKSAQMSTGKLKEKQSCLPEKRQQKQHKQTKKPRIFKYR